MDENTPNAVVSYYAKGSLIALGLDLLMRHHSKGKYSLDDVMRYLWKEHGKKIVGVNQYALDITIISVMGPGFNKTWHTFKKNYIDGTLDLPLQLWLPQIAGIEVAQKQSGFVEELKLALGIRFTESSGWLKLSHVLDDGLAQQAGLAPNDLISSINSQRVTGQRLNQVLASLQKAKHLTIRYFRQDQEHQASIPLKLIAPPQFDLRNLNAS
jgi:predicted metalloprotease with PDZ domain